MGWGTADTTALGPQITRDKLPFMSASLAEQLTDPKDTPYNFVAGTNYTAQAQIAAKYIDRTTSGSKEIAFFHNNSAFGTAPIAGLRGLHQREEPRLHGQDVPDDHRNAPPSMRSSCRRSQRGRRLHLHPECSDAGFDPRQGHEAPWPDVEDRLPELLRERGVPQAGRGRGERHDGVQPFTPVTFNVPGNKAPDAFLKARGSSLAEQNIFYLQGWYTMAVMLQGIDTLIKGKKAITGPNLKVRAGDDAAVPHRRRRLPDQVQGLGQPRPRRDEGLARLLGHGTGDSPS